MRRSIVPLSLIKSRVRGTIREKIVTGRSISGTALLEGAFVDETGVWPAQVGSMQRVPRARPGEVGTWLDETDARPGRTGTHHVEQGSRPGRSPTYQGERGTRPGQTGTEHRL